MLRVPLLFTRWMSFFADCIWPQTVAARLRQSVLWFESFTSLHGTRLWSFLQVSVLVIAGANNTTAKTNISIRNYSSDLRLSIQAVSKLKGPSKHDGIVRGPGLGSLQCFLSQTLFVMSGATITLARSAQGLGTKQPGQIVQSRYVAVPTGLDHRLVKEKNGQHWDETPRGRTRPTDPSP
ncbi:hypothetical protein IWX47DRAFT_414187 [Phyllosticta citricarpa]